MNIGSLNNDYERSLIDQLANRFRAELPEIDSEVVQVAANILFQHRHDFDNFKLSLSSIISQAELYEPLIGVAEKIFQLSDKGSLKRARESTSQPEPKRRKTAHPTQGSEVCDNGVNEPISQIKGLFQALWSSSDNGETIRILEELSRLASENEFLPAIAALCTENIVDLLISPQRELAAAALSLFDKLNGKPIVPLRPNCAFSYNFIPEMDDGNMCRYGIVVKMLFLKNESHLLTNRLEFRSKDVSANLIHAMLNFLKDWEVPLNCLLDDLAITQQQALHCLMVVLENNVSDLTESIKNLCCKELFLLAETTQNKTTLELALGVIAILIFNMQNGELGAADREDDERGAIMQKGVSLFSNMLGKEVANIDLVIRSLTRLIDSDINTAQDFAFETFPKMLDFMKSDDENSRVAAMIFFAEFESYHLGCGISYEIDHEQVLSAYIDSLMHANMNIKSFAQCCLPAFLDFNDLNGVFAKHLIEAMQERNVDSHAFISCLSALLALGELKQPNIAAANSLVVEGLSGSKALNLFANFEILCSGKKIACDRNILATHSPYFFQLFSKWPHQNIENFITLTDIDPQSLELAVRWMYGEEITCGSFNEVMNLLVTADRLLIDNLRQHCIAVLETHLSVITAADILNLALQINAEELQQTVLCWMMMNMRELSSELKSILADDANTPALYALFMERIAPKFLAAFNTD